MRGLCPCDIATSLLYTSPFFFSTIFRTPAPTAPEPPIEPLMGRPPPRSFHHSIQIGGSPAKTITEHEWSQALPAPALSRSSRNPREEWQIRKIVSKRRAGKGFEYRLRWKGTWLPRSEVRNARRLLQEFEAQGQVHCGRKRVQAARKDKHR